jgi:hypothetical protein
MCSKYSFIFRLVDPHWLENRIVARGKQKVTHTCSKVSLGTTMPYLSTAFGWPYGRISGGCPQGGQRVAVLLPLCKPHAI